MKEYTADKTILDACCGSKMFWFQPNNKNVLFVDIRKEKKDVHDKHVNVEPDILVDFTNMPFEDESFYLVVFDPPHLRWAGPNSIMKAQYGQLSETWEQDISGGFDECYRVLKKNGTLVFKWSDSQINVSKVLELFSRPPLFGQRRGTTHWLVFFKESDGL